MMNLCMLILTQLSDYSAAKSNSFKNLLALFIWQFRAEVMLAFEQTPSVPASLCFHKTSLSAALQLVDQ